VTEVELPPGGREVGDPPWDPWQPADIARLLRGLQAPWYVAGGWALDLFRGRQTRAHSDLEIAVPAPDFGAVRQALAGYVFEVAGSGRLWPIGSPAFDLMHQTWVSDPATGAYRLDIFREPQRDGMWVCRRDQSIRMPYGQIIRRTPDGIPYVIPEIALLFKAKHLALAKNQADFDASLPLLDDAALAWLERALRRVHPDHAWTGAVTARRAQATKAGPAAAQGKRALM
jgi:Aminoglycoside-2''-adenylyltransferase